MMFESSSPFDEAAKRPFLGEPTKKRWSPFSGASMYDDDYESDDDSASRESYIAPKLLGDNYDEDKDDEVEDDDEEEVIVFDERAMTFQPVDMNLVMLEERHTSFTDLHQSMTEIAMISADLSAFVNDQDGDIENLQSMAIESSEHAQEGVKHLLRVNRQREFQQRQRLIVALLLLAGVFFWAFGVHL